MKKVNFIPPRLSSKSHFIFADVRRELNFILPPSFSFLPCHTKRKLWDYIKSEPKDNSAPRSWQPYWLRTVFLSKKVMETRKEPETTEGGKHAIMTFTSILLKDRHNRTRTTKKRVYIYIHTHIYTLLSMLNL